ncbi:MAG: energy-coupling factor transporter ATPase [Candidatus Binatia bacterium]|nr:energy-coupling factor transporter ATPase [Candidatus Binatia bacterium]
MKAASELAVCLRGVSFVYDGASEPALREVNLAVGRGQMVVVMGPSHAGKSTLAKILNRTVPAFQSGSLRGEVWLLGQRCSNETVADFAGRIGLVAQDFEAQLFSTSVECEVAFALEQFGIAPAAMRERVRRAMRAVGLEGFEQRDPATLSGGEKQRLAIASMLALEPELLVFDEPTTDLDPAGKEEVLAVLAALRAQGRTLVVVEHETFAAEMADWLVFMVGGEVVRQGSPGELLRDVELCLRCAVRPPDTAVLAKGYGWPEVPTTIEAAAAKLEAQIAKVQPVESAARDREPVRGAAPPLLEVDRVSVRYRDAAQPALENISFSVRAGELIALLGQNGSGKTTLAKCLNGLLPPAAGEVRWRGVPLAELPLSKRAAAVGYVFQNPDYQIFADRVYDEVAFGPRNVGLSAEEVQARVGEALTAVDLLPRADDDPFWLTKGERQRLAVASLLALRPEVLVLDEPTTGLDYREQRQMMELVRKLQTQGMAVIIITHSVWLAAEYAKRVLLLRSGRLVFDGSVAELFAQRELLESARLRVPAAVELGQRYGLSVRSADELVDILRGG